MANGISDTSRHFSLLALAELEKIASKYSSVPKIGTLNEEKISWLNERMRSFYESVKKTNDKRFSFLAQSKAVHNHLAHITLDVSKTAIENAWRCFFDFSAAAKQELEQNVKRRYSEKKEIRQFEKFGSAQFGDEIARKALTQSLADKMDATLSENERLAFGKSRAAKQAEQFFQTETQTQNNLLDFAKKHEALNQQIQMEVLATLQTAFDETDITNPQNPFYAENLFANSLRAHASEAVLKNLSDLQKRLYATKTGKDNTTKFDFYAKQYEALLPPAAAPGSVAKKKIDKHQFEILARNLKADVQKSLEERYLAWQLEEIDRRRKAYLAELYKKIAQFKKLEELLAPFINKFGRLWDLSRGNFNDYGFDILKLKEFAELLEQDASLQELADLIGRQQEETERYEKELRETVACKTEFHPKPAYRGQISGLRLSGEIASVLPSELALSKNPATKLYFAQKFAERKLLSYSYTNRQKSYREEKKTEEHEVAVKEKKQQGPVIICVDTSVSMNGTPERVAKTITFALAKKCLAEERGCYLISFSTGIEVQSLCERTGADGITALVQFLRKSFNGRTNAGPALQHALTLLHQNDWKNADVLVVSDMIMGDFSDSLVADIKTQQKKETKFYSLVIGHSGNKNAIDVFDESWSYDSTARDAMRHLVRQIKQIR